MQMTPDLAALQTVEREESRRLVRKTPVTLLDYKPSSAIVGAQLAPAGSIAVYFAQRGNELLAEIKAAVRCTDGGRDRRVFRKVVKQFAKRRQGSMEEAATRAASCPVLAELSCGASTLVKHMFIEDEQLVGVTLLPYNGGRVRAEDFTFTEYVNLDDEDGMECVLIRHAPELTPAEAAALDIVPPDLVHVFVAPGDIVSNTVLPAVAFHVLVWGFVAGTFTISSRDDQMRPLTLEETRSLGPVGSARAMLHMRRETLRGRAARQ